MQDNALNDTVEYERDDDPIVDEIRRIRAKQAASYGYDLRKQLADSRRKQFLWGNDVVQWSKETGRMELIHKGTGRARFNFEDVGREVRPRT